MPLSSMLADTIEAMGDLSTPLIDRLGRQIHDLRISVTDRCNFRCRYCMPREVFGRGYQFLPRNELLNFEEIERVARIFARHGVKKIRLTGGEPLIRTDLDYLIERLANLDGIVDVSLTTNASLLTRQRAQSLKDAGLRRLNISLDAIDNATFKRINDVKIGVEKVLEGIDIASATGFDSLKVNMVVKKGMNEHSILPMARYFHGSGHILRFIEFMDVGNSNGWIEDAVVSARQIVKSIHAEMPIEPAQPNYLGEVAKRWRYIDGGGEIGVISSVTQPFCGDCSRIRLSAIGSLYTCLFATQGHDLRDYLRRGCSERELTERICSIWSARSDRYSETRTQVHVVQMPKIEMSYIGG